MSDIAWLFSGELQSSQSLIIFCWCVDNLKIHSLSLLCSSTHSPMHGAHVFVVLWTTPLLPALPLPVWLPSHFHGHVFGAFSILKGEFHVSLNKECAKNWRPCPQQVDVVWLHCSYRTKPSVHVPCTDFACVCGPPHSLGTVFLRILDFTPHTSMDAFLRYPACFKVSTIWFKVTTIGWCT